jgi:hypothetical protein
MKEDESKPAWVIELGLYPGILFGIRTYEEQYAITYVLYMPFVDISLTTFK